MRMLKCPRCKQQRAWLIFGTKRRADGTHQHYKQKRCNCGYEGKPTYGYRYQVNDDCFICKRKAERRIELGLDTEEN